MLHRPKYHRVTRVRSSRSKTRFLLGLEPLEARIVLSTTPLITEFMAAGATLPDYAGDTPDWIELHNPTTSPIDLAGWYLTDSSAALTRWQFPSQPVSVLAPDEYLVIFASSKAGAPDIPATELHTNFGLDAGGEYLGLVMPDGVTLADQYAPLYPEQLPGISYGAGGMTAIDESFVGEGTGAAILVPTNGLLGDTWTGGQPFDDSTWTQGAIGVGYETGTQGAAHLLSVTNNNSLDGNDVYQLSPGDLSDGQRVNIDRTHQFANLPAALQGLDYILAANDDKVAGPGFSIDVTFDAGATLYLSIDSRVGDDNTADGPTLGNGVMDWVLAQGWTDTGMTWNKANESATPFHVYSLTPDGTSHTFYEQNDGGARNIYSIAGGTSQAGNLYDGLISTDLETALFGQSGSAYLRIPFDVADPNLLTSLTLDIHYDDGFVAYLNGTKIAERNAPAMPVFDSVSTADHPDSQALVPEAIDVSAHLDDLVAGENILAIQGLNRSSTNSDFLILPLLTGTRTVDSPASYFTTPTPGAVNVPGTLGFVSDTRFSVDRGFFDTPFSVEIATDTLETEIRYTTDGSVPTATTGTIYTEPINIASTTVLRAAAFRPGYLSTNVDTQTYLFLNDVLQQDGSGLPSFAPWGHVGADWEVDPDITGHADPDNRLTVDDLQSIPTISLVLPWDDMFGGGGQGIYISGASSPRGTSVEMILPDGSTGFQVDGSVQIQGGTSDDRWKSDKLSMRVKFTKAFGPTKLDYPLFGAEATDQFDTFILDATLNHGWTHPSIGQTSTAKFIQDQFVADIQNAMGGYAPHARYHHLYINGLYWGMYYVHERPDESFAADYLGGDKEDYDVLKHTSGTVVSGSSNNYQTMLALARQDLSNDVNFQNLASVLDVDDLIDYMLANFYAGNEDWDHHNWYATFNRVDPNGRWRFHSWDAEHVLESVSRNVTAEDTSGAPSEIHQNLTANAEYRRMFADHIQEHFFNDGALTPANTAAAYQRLMDEIDRAVVGESARWGDNRVSAPYTRSDWLNTQNNLINNYFPNRSSNVLSQLRNRNLFPNTDAPIFSQHGGHVASGYDLALSAPTGTIYYTLDGSDPRETGGALSSAAVLYTGAPINITSAVTVRARTLDAGEWSAINEADFIVAPAASAESLRITEINFNPHDANPVPGLGEEDVDNDQFEFIELKNVSTQTIDLSGVQFVEVLDGTDLEGIVFTFSQQTLEPSERTLVVRNQDAFESRYGMGLNIAGVFSGKLSNSGEQITLRSATGVDIQSFEYRDSSDWPGRADGTGSTLEVVDTAGNYNSASNWRSSNEFGGSPATEGTGPIRDVIVNELLSRSGGTATDFVELYNTTGSPIDIGRWYLSDTKSDLFQFEVPGGTSIGTGGYLVLDETQLGFALDGQDGDDIWLVASDSATGKPLRFVQHLEFDATDSNVSLGRWLDGDAGGTLFPMTAQTPGSVNSGPVFGDLLISEVHYNPESVPPAEVGNIAQDELEFVEFYNNGGTALDISNWSIRGFGFTFAAGTTIAAGETIVVVRFDPTIEPTKNTAFRNVFGTGGAARLFGPATGQLNNAGENIQLMRPEDPLTLLNGKVLVDSVQYGPLSPWPAEADGGGKSLTRTLPRVFAPFVASWTASTPDPGRTDFVTIPADFNLDGNVDGQDRTIWEDGFGTTDSALISDGDANDDGDVDGIDFLVWQRNYSGGETSNSTTSTITAENVVDNSSGATHLERFEGHTLLSSIGSSTAVFGPVAPTRILASTWGNGPHFSSHEAGVPSESLRRELAIDAVMSRIMGPVVPERWGQALTDAQVFPNNGLFM